MCRAKQRCCQTTSADLPSRGGRPQGECGEPCRGRSALFSGLLQGVKAVAMPKEQRLLLLAECVRPGRPGSEVLSTQSVFFRQTSLEVTRVTRGSSYLEEYCHRNRKDVSTPDHGRFLTGRERNAQHRIAQCSCPAFVGALSSSPRSYGGFASASTSRLSGTVQTTGVQFRKFSF